MALLMGFLCLLTLVLCATIAWATGGPILRGLGLWPAVPGKSSSLGVALLLGAANLACLAMAAGLAFCAAMATVGRVRVRLSHGTLELARGVGAIGRIRRLEAGQIVSLRETVRIAQAEGGAVRITEIALERREGKPVRFGGDLTDEGRRWIRGMLAEMLRVPDTTEGDGGEEDDSGDDWADGSPGAR